MKSNNLPTKKLTVSKSMVGLLTLAKISVATFAVATSSSALPHVDNVKQSSEATKAAESQLYFSLNDTNKSYSDNANHLFDGECNKPCNGSC